MTMTCLITGATSGIGEAIATRLAARGADVLAVARTAESGRAAAARIRRRQPAARIEVLTADLADLDQVRSLAADVIARRTRLDVLILNAVVARRLAGTGVTANAADPGFARTRLGRDAPGAFGLFLKLARPFQLDPARAADTPIHLATAPDLAQVSSGYFRKCRPADPARPTPPGRPPTPKPPHDCGISVPSS